MDDPADRFFFLVGLIVVAVIAWELRASQALRDGHGRSGVIACRFSSVVRAIATV